MLKSALGVTSRQSGTVSTFGFLLTGRHVIGTSSMVPSCQRHGALESQGSTAHDTLLLLLEALGIAFGVIKSAYPAIPKGYLGR